MIPAIQFLFGEYVPRCAHRIDKHFDYFVLQFIQSGRVTLFVGDEVHHLEGPCFFSSYPGPRIRFHPAAPRGHWVHRYIAFRTKSASFWSKSTLFPIPPQAVTAGDYGERFDELLHHALRSDHWSHLRASHLLEGLLIDLAETRARSQQQTPELRRILQKLDSATTPGDLDYLAIAREFNISARTLRRRVQQAVGMSPHAYVLHARISRARQLLGQTDLPPKMIAQQLGYRDVYFFSRQFRKLTGVPPIAYRKSRQV